MPCTYDNADDVHRIFTKIREEKENNLPQMKPLFFLYVWLNLTRIAGLRKEDLVKHIIKKKFRRVDYFFRLPLPPICDTLI